jgi:NADH-quinone oxidoreductase subunit G
MRERHELFQVIDALEDQSRVKVAAVAPSVRVAMSEEFGLPPGRVSMGQIVAGLKLLGFDYVFDTNFSADLTIMEEGTELLSRLRKDPGAGPLPMFTSCCPGWINLVEKNYPELIPHLSSCKSPQGMMGALIKNVWAPRLERDPADVVSVSVMPCTAKKGEAHRPADRGATYSSKIDGPVPNNDYVLTTREIGRLFRLRKIALPALDAQVPDDPLGESTGAAVLFGATGGVMEAALRTAYELASGGQELPKMEMSDIRGLQGVKSSRVCIPNPDGKGPGAVVRVGVVHGTAETRALLERMKLGDPAAQFDFVEVMACRGGCIGGGGQSKSDDALVLQKRMAHVYNLDEKSELRKSHDNPSIQKLYESELGRPGSARSHALLHTHYSDRSEQTT